MASKDSGNWNGNGSVGFSDLPTEMKSLIFSHLDTKTKKDLRLVCHEWKTVAEDLMKFNVTLEDDTFDSLKAAADLPINTLVVKNFHKKIMNASYTRSGLPKRIREIVLGPGVGFPGDSRRLPHPPYTVRRSQPNQLDINWGNTGISGRNIHILLNCNPYLKSLKVTGSAFKGLQIQEFPDLSGIKLECLTSLDINFGHFPWIQKMSKHAIDPFVTLLRNNYPSLKTLKYSSTAFKADIKLFISLLQCIANHSGTLKHVEVFHTTVYSLPNRNESGNWFSSKKYNELKDKLKNVRLDFMSIDLMRCGPNVGIRWKELEAVLMSSQTKLRTLKVMVNGRNYKDWDMEGTLRASESTLVEIEFHLGCFCDTCFDFSLLKNCHQLKKINVQIVRSVYGVMFGPSNESQIFRSIQEVPRSVRSLRLSHMLQDKDAVWISRNLVNLEELIFGFLVHASDEDKVLNQFVRFISLPKLKQFRLCAQHCEKISVLCLAIPGLINLSTGFDTNVAINRNQFALTLKAINILKCLGYRE